MGLLERATPSDAFIRLERLVKKLKRRAASGPVPILVVEGTTDVRFLGRLATSRAEQIFAAGDRALVEGLLMHLKNSPIDGCECVFLTDCDAKGKPSYLKADANLVVTDNCDLEADLVALGIVDDVVRQITDEAVDVESVMTEALGLGLVLSTVRRAAHADRISMKKSGGARFSPMDLDSGDVAAWRLVRPTPQEMVGAVGRALRWSAQERARVASQTSHVRGSFKDVCTGKDVIDFTVLRLRGEGFAAVDAFEIMERAATLALARDLSDWVVQRRIRAWEQVAGVNLLSQGDDDEEVAGLPAA